MFNNHEVGESAGLEAVFRSQQFGRAVGGAAAADGSARGGREASMFPKSLDRTTRPAAASLRKRDETTGGLAPCDDVCQPTGDDAEETPLRKLPTASPLGGTPGGEERAATPAATPAAVPSKPPNNGFRTAAVVSGVAAAALVVAGVTSGAGQHPSPVVSAQGKHTTGRLHGGSRSSAGGASPGTAAAGGAALTGAPGARWSLATLISSRTRRALGAGGAPGGHVSISGAATTTGGAVPAPVTPPASGSTGSAGSPPAPPSTGGNPGTPAGLPVENTVTGVVTSVTDAADQLGASVPAAASTTGALGNVVGGVDQTFTSAGS